MTQKITSSVLKSLSSPESFSRGFELYQSDAVFDTFRQDNLLTGKCEGSSAPFYRLSIQLDDGGIQEASCTCPYDWGGYCKHIIALALTYIHDPEAFSEQKSIEELLGQVDKDVLVDLIVKLVAKSPDLNTWLRNAIPAVATKSHPAPSRSKRKTKVSRAAYQRQIQSILLHSRRMSGAYGMMGDMLDQLDLVRDTAREFLQAGDAQDALVILTTLLTEISENFEPFDDSDGTLGEFFSDLALPLVEAILSANLKKSELISLSKELGPIILELSGYGIDDLGGVLAALDRGWCTKATAELESYDPDETILVEAKLNILERQNRVEEYLKLCLETGENRRYILKQIEVGEFEKAQEIAWKNLTQANDALIVAKAFREAGRLSDALPVAEKGLDLNGSKHALGTWLGPIEQTQGRITQAIQAHLASFTDLPSLEQYCTLEKLSGTGWEQLRTNLMQVLQASHYTTVLVDVYLYEGTWDLAIGVADQADGWDYSLLEKVADTVLPFRPDWVIQASRKQAEGLIAKTQSKYYFAAAQWLAKMKQAYLSSGRKVEWLSYLDELKSTFARRPSLQEELRKL